jgi:chromodomain-helicase-DNA-binding protein 4
MSSPIPDPILLFTPQKSTSPVGLPPTTDEIASSDKSSPQTVPKTRQRTSFFIEPPVLTASQKELYRQVPEELKEGATFDRDDIDAVVGEHRQGTDLYYFVRFKDGLAHKVRITLQSMLL